MIGFEAHSPLLPEILCLHGKWQSGRPAVVCGPTTLTWDQFDAHTNRVANGLIEAGVRPGDSVAVLMSNGIAMVEVLFGIIKSGGVCVPLNTTLHDDALIRMVADAQARIVIATEDHHYRLEKARETLTSNGVTTFLCADRKEATPLGWVPFRPWRDRHSTVAPRLDLADTDPCNIIYSSGTTGLPKGIVHTHRGRLNWAYDLAITLRYHPGARTLCPVGLFSNISWVSMLCTLLAGGMLVVMERFDPKAWLEHVRTHRITHTAMVPLQFQRILEFSHFSTYDLSSLQAVVSAGSPLFEGLKRQAMDAFGCDVIELYGLTEGLITTLRPEDAERKLSSVGKPLIGTDIRIIDEDGKEVPDCVAGEIVGRGRIVMPGYHRRDDATIKAIWIDEEGRRWLRTGDIGKLDQDGFLYIVDRKKDMILSGGQNVFPADIEAVMIAHHAVGEVAVIGVPHQLWGEAPYAIVVRRAGVAVTEEALIDWTNARLGRFQRLCGIEFRDHLPRNPNGKVLKRELRQAYWEEA